MVSFDRAVIPIELTPTRLHQAGPRREIPIAEPRPPSRWRGLMVAGRLTALLGRLLVMRLRSRSTPSRVGVEVRTLFQELGGLWIKAGQLLSLRVDLFPQPFCEELAKLQHSSIGFPTPLARRIIEKELGGSVDDYFDEFDDRPFAVASIGQVFRARLRREGIYVAVKVQRPFVDQECQRDLTVIQWIVRLLEIFRVYPHIRWDLGLQELRDVMQEELNYHYEASNMRRMRQTLKAHKIYVPRLFQWYCTKRLLVTEFVHGALMSDYVKFAKSDPQQLHEWLVENNIQPKKVARRLINSIFRQLLEDNLYHGDLHPGNIVLLRNSRIALIDFGTASFTEKEYLDRFRLFVRALATRDYSKAADLCFMLTARLPNIDLEPVKEKLVQELRLWTRRTLVRELPYHSKSLENATLQLVRVLLAYKCTMEWAWLRIHRAFTTLDVSLVYLYPNVNYSRMLQKYFERAEVRSLKQMFTARMALRSMGAYRTALDIQDRVNEYTMFQGQLVRRQAQVFEGTSDKFAAFLGSLVTTLAICIGIAGLLAVVAFLEQHHGTALHRIVDPRLTRVVTQLPALEYPVWIGVLVAIAYVVRRLVRTSRMLREKDVHRGQRVAAV